MFAPTYRGNTQSDAYYPYDKIDMDGIAKLCEQDYAFIFKMHPFIQEKVDIPVAYATYVKDLSQYGDINDMFYITDILITDFSSNIYEFALHKKANHFLCV
ncbi:MAG: CDP-glycerol glycerophosphotransferase family protein [Longicatena caecimuris]|uniref:CDP-glycerol glycerophosphotransferase family protein n=1 Tax=Longicatena caecimuris TaxID=1796635 RepID=UPI0039925A0E